MIMQAKALLEHLQFSRSAVTSIDWNSYPILIFPDVPEVVMDPIDRPRERPWGGGRADGGSRAFGDLECNQ